MDEEPFGAFEGLQGHDKSTPYSVVITVSLTKFWSASLRTSLLRH
jgi:hypothetical protein